MKKILILILSLFITTTVFAETATEIMQLCRVNGNCASALASDDIDAALIPGADDTYDLGSASLEWQDLFIDGTATIDTLTVDLTSTHTGLATFNNHILLDTAATNIRVLRGATIDADITSAAPESQTGFYLTSNAAGNRAALMSNIADANGFQFNVFKTRAAANSTNANTIIASGDDVFQIVAFGADGADYVNMARILIQSAGTPGLATDMPGEIVFETVPDNSGTLTTALTIQSDQDLVMTGDLVLADGQNLAFTGASSANQACDTTCTGGCIAGWDTGTSVFVACTNAIADTCLCTK